MYLPYKAVTRERHRSSWRTRGCRNRRMQIHVITVCYDNKNYYWRKWSLRVCEVPCVRADRRSLNWIVCLFKRDCRKRCCYLLRCVWMPDRVLMSHAAEQLTSNHRVSDKLYFRLPLDGDFSRMSGKKTFRKSCSSFELCGKRFIWHLPEERFPDISKCAKSGLNES